MANSMTGFGRAQQVCNGREITLEVKSVNSRYFEYSGRLPRSLSFMEDPLKKAVAAKVSRGKVELHLSVYSIEGANVQISPNMAVARGYYDALLEISNALMLENDIKASNFIRMPDVFTLSKSEEDQEELSKDILMVAQEALQAYNAMRLQEGEKLVQDITERLSLIENMLCEAEEGSAGRVQRYTEKLAQRLQDILADTSIDQARILTEAAVFADKTAVDEETVRLRSHIEQFRSIISQQGQVGRKLDFLTQEINREINTIGSKCQELDITRIVVDMKAELEKIREQIQNLE